MPTAGRNRGGPRRRVAHLALTALVLVVVMVWGVRLTSNWVRGWPGLHHEDWRYVMLRKDAKVPAWIIDFSGVHLYPTMQVWLACLGMYAALTLGHEPLGALDWAAAADSSTSAAFCCVI